MRYGDDLKKGFRMTTTAFDTLKAAKTLAKAGFTNKQADAQVEVLTELTNELATKKDLELMSGNLMVMMWKMQFTTVGLIVGGVVVANFAIAKYLVIPAAVEAVMLAMGK